MKTLRAFAATRRSAVAVIMAVSLAPLMFLVGIAIDITFLSQTRTQTAFAAQAAATQATRIAAATYQYETNYLGQTAGGKTMTQTLAAQDAIAAGNAAGNLWYPAEVGLLTRGSNAPVTTLTTYDGATNGAINTSQPPNFQAVVSDVTTYPPIFNPLFNQTKNWVYTSNATASTQFQYAQILLMLDTSGSMLIGADNTQTTGDIARLQAATVCPPASYGITQPSGEATLPGDYTYQTGDNDSVNFSAIPNYVGDPTGETGTPKCSSGGYNGYAGVPCALACHSTTTTSSGLGGYSADFYGLARYLGLTLRIDVLFSATEQVIEDMESSEAVADQLSVGVFNFSTDVFPLVTGSSGDALPEATANLQGALTQVEQADAKQTPMETYVPQVINGSTVSSVPSYKVANEGGDTNFPLSLQDLEAGNAVGLSSTGTKQPLTANGSGNTQASPLKFIFIVTDGMEDDSSNNGAALSGYHAGEMTSITNEGAGTGTCSYLKNTLKYTVYVLYVDYYPVSSQNYYNPLTSTGRTINSNTNTDYPGSQSDSAQNLSEVTADTGEARYSNAPNAKALQACATTPTDFYEANNSTEIQTALSDMLKSALASTIKLTN